MNKDSTPLAPTPTDQENQLSAKEKRDLMMEIAAKIDRYKTINSQKIISFLTLNRKSIINKYRTQLIKALDSPEEDDEMVTLEELEKEAEEQEEDEEEEFKKMAGLSLINSLGAANAEDEDGSGEEEFDEEEEFNEEDIKAIEHINNLKNSFLQNLMSGQIEGIEEGEEVKDMVEENGYGISDAIVEFDVKKMKEKNVEEVVAMMKDNEDLDAQFLAFFAVQKNFGSGIFSKEKLCENEIIVLMKDVYEKAENRGFEIILVRFLNELVKQLDSKEEKKKIFENFFEILIEQLKSFDANIICFSLNIISEIIDSEFFDDGKMKKLLGEINNIVSKGKKKADYITAMKYKTLNQLIKKFEKENFLLIIAPFWIVSTFEAFGVTSAWGFRDTEYEEFLKSKQKQIFEKIFNEEEFKKSIVQACEEKPGSIFFILHIFDELKKEVLCVEGMRTICQREVINVPGTGT